MAKSHLFSGFPTSRLQLARPGFCLSHMTDDEFAPSGPMHQITYPCLASPVKGSGCLWKDGMLWYTLLKIQAALAASTTPFILLAEKGPIRMRFGRDAHGIVMTGHCRVKG